MQNSPFPTTHFPSDWKQALIKPLLEKAGQGALFNHLRPISNLQFASKLAERVVCDETYENLMLHDLLPELQSAYRKRYSTETALLRVQNDILLNMDRPAEQVTLLVPLDLSAAFDTMYHDILVCRLESSFGITGTALKWFRSYLAGRSQRVSFKNGISDSFRAECLRVHVWTLCSSVCMRANYLM